MSALKLAKRVTVALIGGTVLLIGVIMIITPGPALVVIPAGLAILAIEFAWARRWLHRAREFVAKANDQNNNKAEPNQQSGFECQSGSDRQSGSDLKFTSHEHPDHPRS
jgi:tellurite resistance protein TerC